MGSDGKNIMLMASQSGGKTTFLGGLAMVMQRNNRKRIRRSNSLTGSVLELLNIETGLTGEYNVKEGDATIFEGNSNSVLNRMRSQQYPQPTEQRDNYILEFEINKNLKDAATITLTVMDIPGEVQKIQKLRDEAYNEGDVETSFTKNGIKNRPPVRKVIEDPNKDVQPKEWEVAFLHNYLTSNRIILLVNLHKVQRRKDLDFYIDEKLIEKISNDDRIGLLLFTAVDVVDYDPENFSVGSLSGGGVISKNFDDKLMEKLDPDNSNTPISPKIGNQLFSLADKARQEGLDMFGVSVPAESKNRISDNKGQTVVKGFDNVGKWLKQT